MKLKPCPFCGNSPIFGETTEGAIFLYCQGCRASTFCMFTDKCDATSLLGERWNTRTPQDIALAALVEAAKSAYEFLNNTPFGKSIVTELDTALAKVTRAHP